MSEGLTNRSNGLASDICFSLLTAFVLYTILLAIANFAYAPEGKPGLGEYIAIRVLGLSLAISALQFLRSRRLRREERPSAIPENPISDRRTA